MGDELLSPRRSIMPFGFVKAFVMRQQMKPMTTKLIRAPMRLPISILGPSLPADDSGMNQSFQLPPVADVARFTTGMMMSSTREPTSAFSATPRMTAIARPMTLSLTRNALNSFHMRGPHRVG